MEFLEPADGAAVGGCGTGGGGSLERGHMAAQHAGGRQAEDEVHALRPAQVEHLGRAVMAVAAEQDLDLGPMLADRTDQSTQMRGDLAALRPPRRTQHGGDEPAGAVEDHDRLEAVVVVMGVEQPQLLAAVHRVEGVVDVEHDPLRDLGEGGAVEPDHPPRHPQQHAPVGQVLQSAHGGLRAEVALARQPLERHLEHRVAPQRVGVDAVLVAGGDHQHPEAQYVRDAVHGARRVARIIDAGGEPPCHVEPPLHLPQRQEPGVRRQRPAIEAGAHRFSVHG